jgi:biofilm protein TabA
MKAMIHDTLKNAGLYAGVSPVVAQAFEFIAAHDWAHMAPGRYPIRENAAYLNYTTGPLKNWAETPFEAHKDYLDIHVVLQGAEIIGQRIQQNCCPKQNMTPHRIFIF